MRRGARPDPEDGSLEALGREEGPHGRTADREAGGVREEREEEEKRERERKGGFSPSALFFSFPSPDKFHFRALQAKKRARVIFTIYKTEKKTRSEEGTEKEKRNKKGASLKVTLCLSSFRSLAPRSLSRCSLSRCSLSLSQANERRFAVGTTRRFTRGTRFQNFHLSVCRLFGISHGGTRLQNFHLSLPLTLSRALSLSFSPSLFLSTLFSLRWLSPVPPPLPLPPLSLRHDALRDLESAVPNLGEATINEVDALEVRHALATLDRSRPALLRGNEVPRRARAAEFLPRFAVGDQRVSLLHGL